MCGSTGQTQGLKCARHSRCPLGPLPSPGSACLLHAKRCTRHRTLRDATAFSLVAEAHGMKATMETSVTESERFSKCGQSFDSDSLALYAYFYLNGNQGRKWETRCFFEVQMQGGDLDWAHRHYTGFR